MFVVAWANNDTFLNTIAQRTSKQQHAEQHHTWASDESEPLLPLMLLLVVVEELRVWVTTQKLSLINPALTASSQFIPVVTRQHDQHKKTRAGSLKHKTHAQGIHKYHNTKQSSFDDIYSSHYEELSRRWTALRKWWCGILHKIFLKRKKYRSIHNRQQCYEDLYDQNITVLFNYIFQENAAILLDLKIHVSVY